MTENIYQFQGTDDYIISDDLMLTMNIAINFGYDLNSERYDQTLYKEQSLSLMRPYKISKSRLQCAAIGLYARSI